MTVDRSSRAAGKTGRPLPAQKPVQINRFLVLEGIGSGSMGVVYAAYDPELDRKVAVKLLNPALTQSSRESTARARLIREAQAMARLSHPNVAAVYDVGTVAGQIFIAMEYIHGKTLKQWIRNAPKDRPWAEVVAAYIQAGLGLAAAHRAGITHRDFKPENALIDDDGRVRVLDFGLARTELGSSSVDLDETELLRSVDMTRSDFDSLKLTRAGNLTGTPAYMAPEQLLRKPADARSDQYSFCIALYEALFGKRPFRGKTLATLKKQVILGKVPEPPAKARVPAWVFRILTRGLQVQPCERYPSMDALLTELSRDPSRNRRRVMFALTAAAGLVLGGYGYSITLGNQSQGPQCSDGSAQLTQVWGPAARQKIATAMATSGVSFAEDTWARVAPRLDQYTDAWADMRKDTCEATHVRGDQSDHLLDLRTACLNQRLGDLAQLTHLLASPTPDIVEHAVEAVDALAPIANCGDTEALLADRRTPPVSVAAQVEALEQQLRRIRMQMHTGQYVTGLAALEMLEPEVVAVSFPPLTAAQRHLSGQLKVRVGHYRVALDELEVAYYVSESCGEDGTRAQVTVELVELAGKLARFETAHRWAKHAQALIDRIRGGVGAGALQVQLLSVQGALAVAEGHLPRAHHLHGRALELAVAMYGEDDPRLATALSGLAMAYREQGDYPRALEYFNRVIRLRERSLGPGHPDVARAINSRGGVYYLQLDLERASSDMSRALELAEQALGPTHPSLSHILNSLGALEEDLGHDVQAHDHYQRALKLIEQSLGPTHPRASMVHNNLATLWMVRGEPARARKHYERSLAIDLEVFGDRHPNLGYAHQNLGDVEVLERKNTAAVTHYQHALRLWEQAYGASHPLLAHPLTSLGDRAFASADHSAATQLYQRAVKIREQAFGPTHSDLYAPLQGLGNIAYARKNYPVAVAHLARALEVAAPEALEVQTLEALRLDYAQALWAVPSTRARAREVAGDAQKNLTKAGLGEDPVAQDVAQWLRRHHR